MYVVIFGKKGCPFCVKAVNLCDEAKTYFPDIEYRYIDIHEEGINKSDLEKTVGSPVETVPQIFVNEKHVGGFTEFNDYVMKNVA